MYVQYVFYLEFKNTNVHTSASIVNQPDSKLIYPLVYGSKLVQNAVAMEL